MGLFWMFNPINTRDLHGIYCILGKYDFSTMHWCTKNTRLWTCERQKMDVLHQIAGNSTQAWPNGCWGFPTPGTGKKSPAPKLNDLNRSEECITSLRLLLMLLVIWGRVMPPMWPTGKLPSVPTSDFAASRLAQGSTQSHDIYGFASKLVSIQESNKTTWYQLAD